MAFRNIESCALTVRPGQLAFMMLRAGGAAFFMMTAGWIEAGVFLNADGWNYLRDVEGGFQRDGNGASIELSKIE